MTAWFALLVSIAALIVSIISWRSSVQGTRASIFDRRYEIYSDAEKFIGSWMQKGHPDMEMLGMLVGAWSRSHFLFDEKITTYLRKVWLQAVEANHAEMIISNGAQGNRDEAIETVHRLLTEHADFDKLRSVFQKDLEVKS